MGDTVHAAVEQAAVVRDHQGGAGEFGEPGFQPQRGFQVQMVGRLVQQQQVGLGEQGGGQRHAHAPAAGKAVHRPRLGGGVEAEAGQDGGGAGGGGVGADGAQPLMDFGQPVGRRGVGLGQQGQPLGVALQHDIDQRGLALGRFLLDAAHAGAAGQADFAAIHRDVAGDGAQQGGFAGAVAADEADAPAGIDGQRRLVKQ